MHIGLLALYAVLTAGSAVETGPLVHPLFANHMVLQRTHAAIYGWAAPDAKVTVRIAPLNLEKTATASADGRWRAELGKLPAGGPYTVTVRAGQTVTLTDVLAGEVWLASGQSNASLSLHGIAHDAIYSDAWHNRANAEIAAASEPNIRLFLVQNHHDAEPRRVFVNGTWRPCTPETVASFSAEAYLFARELQRKLGVPVGIVESSLGGTHIREWVPATELRGIAGLPAIDNIAASQLYNGMIAPFGGAPLAGVTWYQGEADASSSADVPFYQTLLAALVGSWRRSIGDTTLPFLIVQLPNLGHPQAAPVEDSGYHAPPVREAQLAVTRSVPRTGLVVTIDVGDANTVHPPNKWDVGARLALAAEALAYGLPVSASGPLYQSHKVEDATLRVLFENADRGLAVGEKIDAEPLRVVPQGQLRGFAIADASHRWVEASAVIDGKSVVVSAPSVTTPVDVRYGWAPNPPCNLYNGAGLPASPFRTDR